MSRGTYVCSQCGSELSVKNRRRHFALRHPEVPFQPLHPKLSPEDRFWPNVVREDGDSGCWIWTSKTDRDGYGYLVIDRVKTLAHRYAYTQRVGPIPAGMELDHLCRVRNCVNPSHLEPVPPLVNWFRGDSPSSRNLRKTHCCNGHEFNAENTRVAPDGSRACRACGRAAKARQALRRADRKEAS